MAAEDIFHIFHRHLPVRFYRPRQVVIFRMERDFRAFPLDAEGNQAPEHVPGPRRIVGMVRIIVAAKGGPAVKSRIFRHRAFPVFCQGQVQMVFFNKGCQIPGAQVVLP